MGIANIPFISAIDIAILLVFGMTISINMDTPATSKAAPSKPCKPKRTDYKQEVMMELFL